MESFAAGGSEDCPTGRQLAADCGMAHEIEASQFFKLRECSRECPSTENAAYDVMMRTIMGSYNLTKCRGSYDSYHFSENLVLYYTSQGCEYDLGELGFEQVGVNGCEVGMARGNKCGGYKY